MASTAVPEADEHEEHLPRAPAGGDLREMAVVGEYQSTGKIIGRGSFATVYKGVHISSGKLVAIKVVDVERLSRGNQKLKEHLNSEIAIMKTLHHENIVELLDVAMYADYIYMVLELCEGGDFSKFLRKSGRLSENKARYFLRQLAKGLRFLRSKNIIHRDLKPQNLLLSVGEDNQTLILKIADFGFARFIEPQSVADTLCGSPLYMAPEILRFQSYTVKADLWSVGIILFEMLTGAPPFRVATHLELIHLLEKSKIRFPDNLRVSKECLDLLNALLQKDPNHRISWEDFFAHPFLGFQQPPQSSTAGLPSSAPSPGNPPLSANRPRAKTISTPQSTPVTPPELASSLYASSEGSHPANVSPRRATVGQADVMRKPSATELKAPKPPAFILDPLVGPKRDTTEDDFVLISPSFSEDEQPYRTIENEKQLQEYLEQIEQQVYIITSLAETRVQADTAEGLALYLKALKLLRPALRTAIKFQHTPQLPTTPPGSARSSASVLRRLRDKLKATLQEVERHRVSIRTTDASVSAEKLLYEYALNMGREASVHEMYSNYTKSEQLYSTGRALLSLLLVDAKDEKEKATIGDLIVKFTKRIDEVSSKQAAPSASS